MKRFAYTPMIAPPTVLAAEEPAPETLLEVSLPELCRLAGIPSRVTGGATVPVVLHSGIRHYLGPKGYYVGVGKRGFSRRREEDAIRVIEVLAHAFHDYAAREDLCGRGYFRPPGRRGRPSLSGRAMSAAERMRRMRSRRS